MSNYLIETGDSRQTDQATNGLVIESGHVYRAMDVDGDMVEVIARTDGRSWLCTYCVNRQPDPASNHLPHQVVLDWIGWNFVPNEMGWVTAPHDGSKPWYVAAGLTEVSA